MKKQAEPECQLWTLANMMLGIRDIAKARRAMSFSVVSTLPEILNV